MFTMKYEHYFLQKVVSLPKQITSEMLGRNSSIEVLLSEIKEILHGKQSKNPQSKSKTPEIPVISMKDMELELKSIRETLLRMRKKNPSIFPPKNSRTVVVNRTLDDLFNVKNPNPNPKIMVKLEDCAKEEGRESDQVNHFIMVDDDDDEIGHENDNLVDEDGNNDDFLIDGIENVNSISSSQPLIEPNFTAMTTASIDEAYNVNSSPLIKADITLPKSHIPIAIKAPSKAIIEAARKSLPKDPVKMDPKESANFPYQAVVKEKSLRKQMHGSDCPCCRDFFKYVGESQIQKISRHRSLFKPPPDTPPGFWDIRE